MADAPPAQVDPVEANIAKATEMIADVESLKEKVTQPGPSAGASEVKPEDISVEPKPDLPPPTTRPVTTVDETPKPAADVAVVKTQAANEVQPIPPGSCGGTLYSDWGRILVCFFVLYSCLAMYFAGLLTVAVHIREGEEYKSLPKRFFGAFDRNYYYSGMGARRKDKEWLYPWTKAMNCPGNVDNYVCTPDCDVPIQPFDSMTCEDGASPVSCGLKCVNA